MIIRKFFFVDKPEFDQSPVLQRAASRFGETGRLICRASGAPKLTFSWSKDMASPIANNTNKYSVHFNKVLTLLLLFTFLNLSTLQILRFVKLI